MIFVLWWLATLALMIVNLAYVASKVLQDHREQRSVPRLAGALAFVGAGSWLCLLPYLGFSGLMSV